MRTSHCIPIMMLLLAFNARWAWPQFSPNLPEWAKPDKSSLVTELRYGVPVWLVGVQAIKIIPDTDPLWKGEFSVATVKIVHVYTGPAKIENTTFDVASTTLMSPNGIKALNLKLNEQALYCVMPGGRRAAQTETTSESLVSNMISPGYGYNFPIQQSDPLFPQALTHAQSIESVAKGDRKEQIRLLETSAKSPIPQLSAWAITTLAESGVETVPQFFQSLADDPKIPIAGQIALDKGLQQLDEAGKAQWNASSTRLDLWRRLVVAPADEDEALSIVRGISEIARNESQHREKAQTQENYTPVIAGSRLFEWSRLAADNPKWAPRARARAVAEVGNLANLELIERDTAFAYLLSRFKALPELAPNAKTKDSTRDEIEYALGPIYGLQRLRPLSKAEVAPLRELQQRVKLTYLQRWFDRLFEQTN